MTELVNVQRKEKTGGEKGKGEIKKAEVVKSFPSNMLRPCGYIVQRLCIHKLYRARLSGGPKP